MKTKIIAFLLASLLLAGLSACSAFESSDTDEELSASGFIATDHLRVAPEISGKVRSLEVAEGDFVQAGEILFHIDDELMQAQADQARAALALAEASITAAQAQQASAQAQVDLVAQQARQGETLQRTAAWATPAPEAFEQPGWYYEKDEQLAAAQAEVQAAGENLDTKRANLAAELFEASNQDFVALEKRLAEARLAYQVADQTLQLVTTASQRETLEPAAQEALDAARADLDTVQSEYERMLSSQAAEDVLEARAEAAVAQARLDIALDTLAALQTGDASLQVKAAQTSLVQAETAITQAQANLTQAQAAVRLVELQIEKCAVSAPRDGVVLALNVEEGELVAAGSVALTIGRLDELSLTVYVPEDEYGQVRLGQEVSVRVDSHPDQAFKGQVVNIAEEAEFTPRNVQTVEGRKSTVYAVKINLPNPDQALKPGMPADVDFNLR